MCFIRKSILKIVVSFPFLRFKASRNTGVSHVIPNARFLKLQKSFRARKTILSALSS